MQNFIRLCLLIALAGLIGCSEEENEDSSSFESGIPTTQTIVSAATPDGVQSSSALASLVERLNSPLNTSCTLNSSSTSTDILDCFQRRLFSEPASNSDTGSLPDDNIFKHVAEFDYRIGQLESRFDEQPSCFSETPTAVTWSVNAGGSNTSLGGTIYLSCRESHSVTDGVDYQNMAFGLNSGVWYLYMRTSYNSSESGRILIAQTDSAGTNVEAWLFSYRDNDGDNTLDTPGAGDAGSDDIRALRVIANSSTNAFFFSTASYNYNNNPIVETVMRSDGTNLSVPTIRVSDSGSSSSNNPLTNSGCVLSSNASSAGDCTSLSGLPSDSGLSTVLQEADITNTTLTDIKALLSLDISAVSQLQTGEVQ